ncbi:D-lactate dehydrogenase [Ascobolus immersus RN42]|uniref:D-lactate dehydrogenase (cytochrome) n=1 Tax=Ascobolus immersus RN42 TaxID=1160509 RepID=A0A3N4HF21_ASCIM|nr:D-lactate dehydrogenase [Ascobolus immersus RN42]
MFTARLTHRALRPALGTTATFSTTSARRITGKDGKSFSGQLMESMQKRNQLQNAEANKAYQRGSTVGGLGKDDGGPGKGTAAGGGGGLSSLGILFGAVGLSCIFYYLGTRKNMTDDTRSTQPLMFTHPPKHDLREANLQSAWKEFVDILGSEHVDTSLNERNRHATSEWSSHPQKAGDPIPFLIVYPSTTQEVSEIVKICHLRSLPITPFSGGTSLEGHFTPTRGGVTIDFHRMSNILKFRPEDLDITVQPCVGWEDLATMLSTHNLFFPPDPGPGACIGGMIGTGCSGTNAARYGTMREWVLSLTVVLADGTIIKTRQRPRKSSAGYDLTKLFIGSEGTLGLVTEATLKLTVKPQHESVAVVTFPSVRAAADLVAQVVEHGVPVAAMELLDDVQMRCINESGTTSRHWKEAPTLFFKFGGTQLGVKEQIEQVKTLAKNHGFKSFEFAKSKEEQEELWSARKEALWSVMALRHNGDGAEDKNRVWTTDVAVPVSRLAEIIEVTKEDISSNGITGSIVGHVGDGNFHAILLFSDKERETVEGVVKRMVKRAIEMEGTVTGEHGVGLVKRDYLAEELGQNTVDLMRRVKMALDPKCLLNCDKVVRME